MADLLRRPGPAGDVAEGAAPVTWSDDGHPAAVLLDLDGTLIDSEPLWSAAVGTLVREHGRPWHLADDAAILGWSIPALSAEVVRRGVRLTEAQVVDRLHHDVGAALHRGVPWRPGARHLLAALHRSGIPLALVSATHRVVVEQVVTQAPDGVFTTVVTGDDPGRPKPAPDPYLRAAQLLGADRTPVGPGVRRSDPRDRPDDHTARGSADAPEAAPGGRPGGRGPDGAGPVRLVTAGAASAAPLRGSAGGVRSTPQSTSGTRSRSRWTTCAVLSAMNAPSSASCAGRPGR